MPIADTELILYSPANVPDDDATTSGGAIDTTSRPVLTQLSANAVIAAVSDGADVRTLTVTGRLPDGTIDTEDIVLTNAVEAAGAKTFERVLKLELSGTDPARTVTVRQGAGGSTIATITPNETTRHIWFQDSASDAAPLDRYEKAFWKNTDPLLTLNAAKVVLTADPDSKIMIGVVAAVDDATSVANRLAAPGGVTFVDDNVEQDVPGLELGADEAIGFWIEQALGASDTPYRSSFSAAIRGTTV